MAGTSNLSGNSQGLLEPLGLPHPEVGPPPGPEAKVSGSDNTAKGPYPPQLPVLFLIVGAGRGGHLCQTLRLGT